MHNFFKPFAVLFTNETLLGACNFIVLLVIARFLEVEDFATWSVLLMILGYGEGPGPSKSRLRVSVFAEQHKVSSWRNADCN